MCGIAGILGQIDEVNRAALERMQHALAHRGPDACGVYASTPDAAGNGVLLAHRRLSILDLSHAADQPMTDPLGGHVIVFNGEIYNYVALRQQLQSRGQVLDSSGDTAVMLRLLAMDGVSACAKLRGMFAFALWDPRLRQLTLARDSLGIKPLYLAVNPDKTGRWQIIFASEVRAIIASGLIGKPILNPDSIACFIWNGFVPGPPTIVQGVASLEPGRFLQISCDESRHSVGREFWSPPRASADLSEAEFGESLAESVRLHLASDVPLGVFLSSGVDSSAVANLASRVSDQPIHTFTLAFEEAHLNEGEHARRIAAAIASRHQEIVLTEQRFVSNLDHALGTLDQPTFDGLNSFYMSQAVREAGLTVALVGTGGDELFGGYATFNDLPKLMHWSAPLTILPPFLRKALGRHAARLLQPHDARALVPPQTRWAKLPEMLESRDHLLALYQLSYALFLPAFGSQLLDPDLRPRAAAITGLPPTLHRQLQQEITGRSALNAISLLEQRLFLGERLLRDSDAASMAVSLEMRLPLVDSVLLEQVNRLKDSDRYHPLRRKAILRRLGLKGLDPALFERPKSGFVLPFDRWIRRNLGQSMTDTMNDRRLAAKAGLNGQAVASLWTAFQQNAPGLYWSRVWAIYVLLDWCRRHDAGVG